MAVITIPKPLRDKLGEDATDALVEVVKEVDLSARQEAILIAEERLERRLTEETGKLREETAQLRHEIVRLEGKIDNVKTELEGKIGIEIQKSKADILKWMFIFWASQIGAVFALLKFFV